MTHSNAARPAVNPNGRNLVGNQVADRPRPASASVEKRRVDDCNLV